MRGYLKLLTTEPDLSREKIKTSGTQSPKFALWSSEKR